MPFEVDGIAAGDTTAATASWRRADQGAPLRRLRGQARKAKVVLDPARRAEMILDRRQEPRLRAGLRAGRGRGPAGRGRRPGRMAGGADGRVRRRASSTIPPEVIRATIRNNQKCFVLRDPQDRRSSPTSSSWSPTSRRATAARRSSPATSASSARGCRTRSSSTRPISRRRLEDRLPKFEQIVFHEKLGTQAERIARIERWPAELAPLVGADVAKAERAAGSARPTAHRSGRRIPRAAGPDGQVLRAAQGEDEAVAARHARITTSRTGPTIACRPIRCRSRSRSPTRSTCWSASGRSTRSRPDRRTLCAAARGARRDPADRLDNKHSRRASARLCITQANCLSQTGVATMRRSEHRALTICSPSSPTA